MKYLNCPRCNEEIEVGRNAARSLRDLWWDRLNYYEMKIGNLHAQLEAVDAERGLEEIRRQRERAELQIAGFNEWQRAEKIATQQNGIAQEYGA